MTGGLKPLKLQGWIYQALKYSNDIKAVKKNKVGRRIGRRIAGKATGRLFGKVFR